MRTGQVKNAQVIVLTTLEQSIGKAGNLSFPEERLDSGGKALFDNGIGDNSVGDRSEYGTVIDESHDGRRLGVISDLGIDTL